MKEVQLQCSAVTGQVSVRSRPALGQERRKGALIS